MFLHPPAVVRPMQHRLSLTTPAVEIARVAVRFDLRHVAGDGAPSPNLPSIVLGPPAHVVTAYHWNHPRGSCGWIHPLRRHSPSVCEALTPKAFSVGSWRFAHSFACVNQLAGNSFRQSVMYLPPIRPAAASLSASGRGRSVGRSYGPAVRYARKHSRAASCRSQRLGSSWRSRSAVRTGGPSGFRETRSASLLACHIGAREGNACGYRSPPPPRRGARDFRDVRVVHAPAGNRITRRGT